MSSIVAEPRFVNSVAVRRDLLRRFMADAPFQPATNLWRAVELPVLASVLPATGRGLDVGCGDGVLTRLLRDLVGASWTLVGVDPDPHETAAAQSAEIYAAVHTTGADAVPEADASFDFAFSNSVLEHIPDLAPCLTETARLLKPGGSLFATVPAAGLHGLMAGPGWTRRISREAYLAETDRRIAHLRYPTVDRWRGLLNGAGLELVAVRSYLSARQVRRWETWANWTGGLLYRLQGARRPPIQIQRSLGLRRAMPRPLRWLAGPAAFFAGSGVLADEPVVPAGGAESAADRGGGLLFEARRR